MSLKKLQLPQESLNIPGSDPIILRGLTLPDVTTLIRLHGDELRSVVENFQASEGDPDITSIMSKLAQASPTLAAEIIALSAREPDSVEEALGLPFPLQVEALEKIARITFVTEGGVKNFAETVIRIATSVNEAMSSLDSPSIAGTERSLAA